MVRTKMGAAGMLGVACGAATAQVGPYTITDLGDFPGAWSTVPIAMNNQGHVVGWANMTGVGGGVRAFLWTAGGGMVQIGPAGLTNTQAVDITDSGLILGRGYQSTAFVGWLFDGTDYEILPPFPAGTTTCSLDNFTVSAVNESRQVVGSVCVGTNLQIHAFFYSPQTGYIDLTAQHGIASAVAISEAGVVTGSASGQACRWTLAGGRQLLGTLPAPFDDGAVGLAVNESGVVVGLSTQVFIGSVFWRSFLHDGAMHEITPTYLERSSAQSINEYRQVVGNIGTSSTPYRDPWLWSPATGTVGLTLVPGMTAQWTRFTRAWDINDRGQILISGLSSQATFVHPRTVVLTPVPSACYANCDQSPAPPVLTVADFTCFLQRYAAGESYANCDNSTVTPILNVQDFTCFLQRYAAGCP